MTNRLHIGMLLVLTITLVVLMLFTGCAKPTPSPEENGNGDNGIAEETDENVETEEPIGGDGSGEAGSALGTPPGSQEVTDEDLAEITGFGPFRFPGAQLLAKDSMIQRAADGTEIYILKFGCEEPLDVVADWYSDNLEAGTTERRSDLDSGGRMAGFQYSQPDESFRKSITIRSAGSNACSITVSIYPSLRPEEDREGTEDGTD